MSEKNWVKDYIGKKKKKKEPAKQQETVVSKNWQETIDLLLKESRYKAQQQSASSISSMWGSIGSWGGDNYSYTPNYNWVKPSPFQQQTIPPYQIFPQPIVPNFQMQTNTNYLYNDPAWQRKYHPSGNGVFFPCE